MKCDSPIHISNANPLKGVEEYDVPCGECPQCLRRKQNEFACLALLEAGRATSMHFLTLTYNNNTAPIAVSCVLSDAAKKYVFVDDKERLDLIPLLENDKKQLEWLVDGDYQYCPSLRREDVRLFLKRCRVAWQRAGNLLPKFKYAAFGEYGSATFRPHYHLQILNAPDNFVSFLVDSWNREFGFCDCRKIPRINQDGSNGFLKVSLYISKYIAKPKNMFPFLIEGVAEMPRRFSSRHFGTESISVSDLKRFYLCQDLNLPNKKELALRIADRSRFISVEGFKFPLPRRLREQIYYFKFIKEEYDPDKGKNVRIPVYKRTALSRLALEASRSRDLETLDRQLRENSEAFPNFSFRDVCEMVTSAEMAASSARSEVAAKNLIVQSKKEKI